MSSGNPWVDTSGLPWVFTPRSGERGVSSADSATRLSPTTLPYDTRGGLLQECAVTRPALLDLRRRPEPPGLVVRPGR